MEILENENEMGTKSPALKNQAKREKEYRKTKLTLFHYIYTNLYLCLDLTHKKYKSIYFWCNPIGAHDNH